MPVVVETPQSLRSLLGREIAAPEWFTVTQERIERFAGVIEDYQWIHVDRERAQQESPYGTTIAHGFLILSLLSHSMRQTIQIRSGLRMGINYGFNRVRYPSPVLAGSRIRGHFTLRSLNELPDGFEAIFDAKMETEGSDKPCCVAEWVVRYYK